MDRPLSDCLSYSKNGIVSTSYRDDFIVKGKSFFRENVITAAVGTDYYVMDATACDCEKVFKLPVKVNPAVGTVLLTVYEGTDYTGVTTLPLLNRDRTSSATTKITLKDTGTGTDKGTEIQKVLYGVDATRQSAGGGTNISANALILDRTKKILLEVTYSDAGLVGYNWEFIEA